MDHLVAVHKSPNHKPDNPEWVLRDLQGNTVATHRSRSEACKDRDERILLAQLKGKKVCYQMPANLDAPQENRRPYFLEPGGKAFSTPLATKLIAEGRLVPAHDGLFAGHTQTYEFVG